MNSRDFNKAKFDFNSNAIWFKYKHGSNSYETKECVIAIRSNFENVIITGPLAVVWTRAKLSTRVKETSRIRAVIIE